MKYEIAPGFYEKVEGNRYISAEQPLIEMVKKEERVSFYELPAVLFIFGMYTTAMCFKDSGTILIFECVAMFLVLLLYIYARIIRKSKLLSRLIKEIGYGEEIIQFTTFEYNVLGLIKIKSKVVEFKVGEFKLINSFYPLANTMKVKSKVLKVTANEVDHYIIIQYFPSDLEGRLQRIISK